MADLALLWDPDELVADLGIQANDLVQDSALKTAVLLSLYLDRQAEAGDPLPASDTYRRGWWADAVSPTPGDQTGSRLWLLARENQTPRLAERAKKYTLEALDWLLQDGVASAVGVEVSFPRPGMIGLQIHIDRPRADAVDYRFDRVWEDGSVPDPIPEEPLPESPIVTLAGEPIAAMSGYLSAL